MESAAQQSILARARADLANIDRYQQKSSKLDRAYAVLQGELGTLNVS